MHREEIEREILIVLHCDHVQLFLETYTITCIAGKKSSCQSVSAVSKKSFLNEYSKESLTIRRAQQTHSLFCMKEIREFFARMLPQSLLNVDLDYQSDIPNCVILSNFYGLLCAQNISVKGPKPHHVNDLNSNFIFI